jgi:hypothetical protein
MNRTDIINHLIKKHNYVSYLEIGIREGINYNSINCLNKTGVDPDTSAYHDFSTKAITSDAFFASIKATQKFDIIFIDGLHLEHQVDKDIENSLSHLSSNGTIVLHDCNPPTIYHARENFHDLTTPARGKWNGTVWKSIVKIRCTKDDLNLSVVDTDWGCGVLQKTPTKVFDKISMNDCLKWEVFDKNRKEILNLITIEEFINLQT